MVLELQMTTKPDKTKEFNMSDNTQNKDTFDLAKQLKETATTVRNNYSSTVQSKFVIGKTLHEAKSNLKYVGDSDKYEKMFETLPFGKKVGDKYIRIYNTEWLRTLSEDKSIRMNLPESYATLYSLTHEDLQSPSVIKSLTDVFTQGTYTTVSSSGEEKDFSTTDFTSTSIKSYLDIQKKTEEGETPEPVVKKEEVVSLFTIKVKKSELTSDGSVQSANDTRKKLMGLEDLIGEIKSKMSELGVTTGNSVKSDNGFKNLSQVAGKVSQETLDQILEAQTKQLPKVAQCVKRIEGGQI